MTTINKITTVRSPTLLTDELIQAHIDQQNADGWRLVAVTDSIGWYRFFWAKDVE